MYSSDESEDSSGCDIPIVDGLGPETDDDEEEKGVTG